MLAEVLVSGMGFPGGYVAGLWYIFYISDSGRGSRWFLTL